VPLARMKWRHQHQRLLHTHAHMRIPHGVLELLHGWHIRHWLINIWCHQRKFRICSTWSSQIECRVCPHGIIHRLRDTWGSRRMPMLCFFSWLSELPLLYLVYFLPWRGPWTLLSWPILQNSRLACILVQ
jgi:hypothetical protein